MVPFDLRGSGSRESLLHVRVRLPFPNSIGSAMPVPELPWLRSADAYLAQCAGSPTLAGAPLRWEVPRGAQAPWLSEEEDDEEPEEEERASAARGVLACGPPVAKAVPGSCASVCAVLRRASNASLCLQSACRQSDVCWMLGSVGHVPCRAAARQLGMSRPWVLLPAVTGSLAVPHQGGRVGSCQHPRPSRARGARPRGASACPPKAGAELSRRRRRGRCHLRPP